MYQIPHPPISSFPIPRLEITKLFFKQKKKTINNDRSNLNQWKESINKTKLNTKRTNLSRTQKPSNYSSWDAIIRWNHSGNISTLTLLGRLRGSSSNRKPANASLEGFGDIKGRVGQDLGMASSLRRAQWRKEGSADSREVYWIRVSKSKANEGGCKISCDRSHEEMRERLGVRG